MEEKIKELINELEDSKKIIDDFLEERKDKCVRYGKTQLTLALEQKRLLDCLIERLNKILESEE